MVADLESHLVETADLVPCHVLGRVDEIGRELTHEERGAEVLFLKNGSYNMIMRAGCIIKTQYDQVFGHGTF